MGLFRMAFTAPGLELGGGDARGGRKGDDAEGLGWGDGCWPGGLVFWAEPASPRFSVLRPPGLIC